MSNLLKEKLYFTHKSIFLELYKDDKVISSGTGFIIENNNKYYLITCWHLISRYNMFIGQTDGVVGDKINVHITEIDDSDFVDSHKVRYRTVECFIPLFKDNKPTWFQLESLNSTHDDIRIPYKFDMVIFDVNFVNIEKDVLEKICIKKEDIYNTSISYGDVCIVVGYPNGFGAANNRYNDNRYSNAICNNRSISHPYYFIQPFEYNILLDGGCQPCMSGSPVYIIVEDKAFLVGMYMGIIHTDDHLNNNNDALGVVHRMLDMLQTQEISEFLKIGLTEI